MEVLIVGGGGREHAMAWKLAQSPKITKVHVLPGNGGTATGHSTSTKISNVDTVKADPSTGFAELIGFTRENKIALVAVGPEAPLVDGLVDALQDAGIPCFGPTKSAARLEASKAFSKSFMERHGIPTAKHQTFTDCSQAMDYIRVCGHRVVIKASGLAAGKGVVLPESREEAEQTLKEIMVDRIFGDAGNEVVIEEYLEGQEVSCLCFTDGSHVTPMPGAQDHKRVFDADMGPNTGGMGAYAPAPCYTPELQQFVLTNVLQATIAGLQRDGITYKGILYAGMMLTKDGPKVLEYNCRFGDPETQVLLPLLESDLVEVMQHCIDGSLAGFPVAWKNGFATTVVCASGGYPGKYENGKKISLPTKLDDNVILFHSGTKVVDNTLVTAGGRVLAVTGVSDSLAKSVKLCYDTIGSGVDFEAIHFRKDIAHRALVLDN